MKTYEATEQAYKNGYDKGYEQGKKDARKKGRWLSAYEYGLKLGITDKEKLEELKEDKWWKFCNGCEQQVKGFHNYCPNCGAKMDGDGNA